jgi:hypothetical protein
VTRNNLAKKTTRDEFRRRTIVRRTLGLGQIDENRSEARMSRSTVGGEADCRNLAHRRRSTDGGGAAVAQGWWRKGGGGAAASEGRRGQEMRKGS